MNARRGTALLVVLAVTVLTVSALAMIVRVTSTASMARHTSRSMTIAADLLHATDTPITTWLNTMSSDVVLPPDVMTPRTPVLLDRWTAGDTDFEVTITAWDQYAMVPADQVRGPLGAAVVDPELKNIVGATKLPRGQPTGLDLFLAAARTVDGARVYPAAPGQSHEPSDDDAGEPSEQRPALGAIVATHNPAPGRINVNTAPMALIEAALRRTQRGDIKQILEARGLGERTILPAAPQQRRGRRRSLELVGVSDAWAFRVDILVGGLHRSWWCVYSRPRPSKPWECVQRLAILQ